MAFEIRKAERRKAKLRLGFAGASGSGKTASSLLVAYGITSDWSKIGFIDTENGSGELYVGKTIAGCRIGEYAYGRIESPFTIPKYLEAIKALEGAGCEVIIIDSLSHAWAGDGGLMDKQGKLADRGGNSYTAWRTITPEHNSLVEAILQSKSHILAGVRAKTEYVQEKDASGKSVVRKVGMAPVFRDGIEYEFSVFFDLAADHTAQASKDRTNLFDGLIFKPTVETGKALLQWLETGTDIPAPVPPPDPPPPPRQAPAPTPPRQAIKPPTLPPVEDPESDPGEPPTGGVPPTQAEVEALLNESKTHKGGVKTIMESLNTRGIDKLGNDQQENRRVMITHLVKFTRAEFDALVKKVTALPKEPAKEAQP